jgi:hypothetical protein
MYPTLFVDAFGRLVPIPERVAPDTYSPNEVHKTLWSTFLDRSVQMQWSTEGSAGTSRVWDVEEAELTYHLGSSRIGFAQVGLEVKGATAVEPPEMTMPDELPTDIDLSQAGWAAVPTLDDAAPPTPSGVAIWPLIQCLDDSLRWYGETEATAYQVTGRNLPPGQSNHYPRSELAWFCVPVPDERTSAVVALASSQGGDALVSDVMNVIRRYGRDFFTIGPLVDAPEEIAAGLDWGWLQLTRGEVGIAVSLPEWSTTAVGWLIGTVFEAALSLDSPPHSLSVRVTRAAPE